MNKSDVNSKCLLCGTGPVIQAYTTEGESDSKYVEQMSLPFRHALPLDANLMKLIGFKKAKKHLGVPVCMSAPVSVILKDKFIPKSYRLKMFDRDYGAFCSCFKRFWLFKK